MPLPMVSHPQHPAISGSPARAGAPLSPSALSTHPGADPLTALAERRTKEPPPRVAMSLAHLSEIGEQTALLVHELRSPLSVILNGLRLCQSLPLPAIARQRLALALEEAERINRMLNEVLGFVRYACHPECHWRQIELNALMGEILTLVAQIPQEQPCPISLEPAPTAVWIRGDRDKLKQVVLNLLSNASDAVGPRGSIRCRVAIAPNQRDGVLQICDRPPAPHSSPRPRPPRQRLASTGLGLGLTLVRRLVEAHGGQFRLDSRRGETLATVELPLLPLPPAGPEALLPYRQSSPDDA